MLLSWSCVVAACGATSVVYEADDSSRVARRFKSTSLKFFGPQQFSLEVLGPVLSIDSTTACGFLDRGEYRGAVVVTNFDRQKCSIETIYTQLVVAGAAAVLLSSPYSPPGLNIFAHDGSRGAMTRRFTVPLMEVTQHDALWMKKSPSGELVRLVLAPDERNEWRLMFDGALWICIMRVFLPAMNLATTIRGASAVEPCLSSLDGVPRRERD